MSALPVTGVQPCALEQAGHERQPLSPDVGLACEEVEHWVGTAADEGYGRGDSTASVTYFSQAGGWGSEQSILLDTKDRKKHW